MSFIERGLRTIVSFNKEWDRNVEEIRKLDTEKLGREYKRSLAFGLTGDAGKYLIFVSGWVIATELNEPCIGIPLALTGAVAGLAAEGHYGQRSRIAKKLINTRKDNPS